MSEEIIIDGVSFENGFIPNPKRGLTAKITHLKQENEQLKKQLEFSRTNKTVLDAERIKYKQALKEIKEIIVECNNCCVEPPTMKFECPKCKEEMIDKIILGCTHYPIYEKIIREELGYEVELINTGVTVSNYLQNYLKENEIEKYQEQEIKKGFEMLNEYFQNLWW